MPVSTTTVASGSCWSSHRRPSRPWESGRPRSSSTQAASGISFLASASSRARCDLDSGARLVEQFLDQKGIAVVVLDQQDPYLLRVHCHMHPIQG